MIAKKIHQVKIVDMVCICFLGAENKLYVCLESKFPVILATKLGI